jgi:glycosyltransferase involved in cell wall biosynthesis
MKIAFVITCLGVGGAEKVVTDLADMYTSRGHKVLIVYLKGEVVLRPSNLSIKLVGLGLESASSLFRAFFTLRSVLKSFDPDIVHSHLVHANIITRLLRLTLRIPKLITTAHNKNEEGRLRMIAYRLTDRLADMSTNVSDEAVAAFIDQKAVKVGRMKTFHNGISTREFSYQYAGAMHIRNELGIPTEANLIVAVGRLNEQKDYPNLLMALSKMKLRTPPFQVLIVGDGPLSVSLQVMAGKLGLMECIKFLGIRRDVPNLLSAADIFVLSSAWEGFPLVVGEAMACECMVVATDCGGVKEFVGKTGLLAPPKNAVALAHQIECALALSPQEKMRYGKAARERICHLYSLDASVVKWLELYGEP